MTLSLSFRYLFFISTSTSMQLGFKCFPFMSIFINWTQLSPTSTSIQVGFICLPFMNIFRNRAQVCVFIAIVTPPTKQMQVGFKCLLFMSIFRNRAQEGARPHTLQFSPTHLTKCKLGFNVCLSWASLEIKCNWMLGLFISPPAEDHHQCTPNIQSVWTCLRSKHLKIHFPTHFST